MKNLPGQRAGLRLCDFAQLSLNRRRQANR